MAEKAARKGAFHKDHPRYKWIALSNTTLGILMATINGSIVLISLPSIFKGIKINPLDPSNTSYLLWMLMGYILVTAVLVVSFGRLGDIYGRVRIYNLGFVIFTLAAVALSLDPFTAGSGALWLILWRVVQAVGGSMLFANSTAILTDAFPPNRRGFALGLNQVAAIAGTFLGLIVGGILASIDWHLVFIVSVPFGIIGTIWAYVSLHEVGTRDPGGKVDWPGNIVFGVGLTCASRRHHLRHPALRQTARQGWGNPWVLVGHHRRHRPSRRLRVPRAACETADVRHAPVQDPRVRVGQHRRPGRIRRPRWPAVHADHLAAGNLAAAARLLLREHAVLGGHLPAAADLRVPRLRARSPARCPTGSGSARSRRPGCCSWP